MAQEIAAQFNLNLNILKQCREQMSLSLEQAAKHVRTISKIESGEKRPTYNQLDNLSDLYQVPRWVFIADDLPEEYKYHNTPAFRKFKETSIFEDSKVRKLVARVEQYRDLLIELRLDMDDPVQKFTPPDLVNTRDIEKTACAARQWLSIQGPRKFDHLKELLAQKGVFIFLTSKYTGWSHIDQAFRGLTITHPVMPIIIINDSDSRKAQSFTLMHELGHLIRDDTNIDSENTADSDIEKWCDKFAGETLMPASSGIWQQLTDDELADIKKLAKKFNVSPHACLVRLRQLEKIEQHIYDSRVAQLKEEYKQAQEQRKQGPARNRVKEVQNQFGKPFINTVLTAWRSKEITLHKAAKLLGLKRPQQFLDLGMDHELSN